MFLIIFTTIFLLNLLVLKYKLCLSSIVGVEKESKQNNTNRL